MTDAARSTDPRPAGIDQISTRWPMIQDPVKFVLRYAPAIHDYLSVFLNSAHDVDDCLQSIMLRVVERGLIAPEKLRGRFRDYLIATVRNSALATLRKRNANPLTDMPLEQIAAGPDDPSFPDEQEWISRWRRIVLAGAWEALENHQRDHAGNLCHTSLRTMVDFPDEDSSRLAERVSRLCGRVIRPDAFRKQVSRARRLFAEFLVADIARTLESPTANALEEELIAIGVMKYVEPYLAVDWRTTGTLLSRD